MPLLEVLRSALDWRDGPPACTTARRSFLRSTDRPRGADVADNRRRTFVTITPDTALWVGTRCCRRSSRAPTPAARRARGRSSIPNRGAERRHARAVATNTDMFTEFVKIFDPQKLWAAGNASENRLRYAQATLQLVP